MEAHDLVPYISEAIESSKTITELKSSFIRSQIRVLSSPLELSPDWRDYGPVTDDDINDKTVDEVLQKCIAVFLENGSFQRISA